MDSEYLIAEEGDKRFRSAQKFETYPENPELLSINWVPFGPAVPVPAVFVADDSEKSEKPEKSK
jgi:hypothetical protein